MIKVGHPVPSFELEGYLKGEFKQFKLEDYRGRWVVLVFYPLDFTFICPTEIKGFNNAAPEFDKMKTQLFGISVDSVHSHKAWEKDMGITLNFPLLSDIKKEVATAYNVLIEEEGTALRGTFVIDPDGILKYQVVSFNDAGRSVGETVRAVQALQSGKLCPVEWKPGMEFVGGK
ncbi:MAG: peroxiredoxin [Candidatus Andersenbacteria bacterium]